MIIESHKNCFTHTTAANKSLRRPSSREMTLAHKQTLKWLNFANKLHNFAKAIYQQKEAKKTFCRFLKKKLTFKRRPEVGRIIGLDDSINYFCLLFLEVRQNFHTISFLSFERNRSAVSLLFRFCAKKMALLFWRQNLVLFFRLAFLFLTAI